MYPKYDHITLLLINVLLPYRLYIDHIHVISDRNTSIK